MNNHLLNDALTVDQVMGGASPPDPESDEPSNRELLEYLGLDSDEIDEAFNGIEDEVKTGSQRYKDRYDSKDSKQSTFWSGGNSAYGNYSRCNAKHDGSIYIYKRGDITLGGARGSDLDGKYPELVIDLAGVYLERVERLSREMESLKDFVKSGPDRFNVLREHVRSDRVQLQFPEVLRLAWPDMKEPPVTIDFWRELWKLLPPSGHTLFTCIGGHGRTGTALAAMILVDDPKISAKDAMDLVRKLHCSHAIESTSQEDYIEEIAKARHARKVKN